MRLFILLISLALAPVVLAAEDYYNPGLSFDAFVSARSYDLNDARGGAGLGANWFFTRNLGVGVETLSENTAHSTFDTLTGSALWRITSGRAALNLTAGGGYDFEQREYYVSAGGGPEYALTRNLRLFGDARAQKPIEGGDIHALFRAGVRVAF